MTENLGAMLREHQTRHEEDQRKREERQKQELEAKFREAEKKAMEEATAFLEKLRVDIARDAKEGYKWDRESQELIYRLPDKYSFKVGGKPYEWFIHDIMLWHEFVSWARESGLSVKVDERLCSHETTDMSVLMHDYYYITVKILEQ